MNVLSRQKNNEMIGSKTRPNSLCFTDRLFHEKIPTTAHFHIQRVDMKSVVYLFGLLAL